MEWMSGRARRILIRDTGRRIREDKISGDTTRLSGVGPESILWLLLATNMENRNCYDEIVGHKRAGQSLLPDAFAHTHKPRHIQGPNWSWAKILLPADNIKLGPYVATNVANVCAMAQVSASLWSKLIWPTCISGSPAFCSPTSAILARSASISRWYLRLNRSSSWDTPSAPLELPVCLADPSRLGWSSSSLSRYLLRRWLYIYRMCVLVLIWCRERMDYRMVPVRLGDWQSFKSCISWL